MSRLRLHRKTILNPCYWNLPGWLALTLFVSTTEGNALAALRVLDGRRYHLRSGDQPEWEEFANKTPHGRRLDIRFAAAKNDAEQTLFVRQDDVRQDWSVELNGRRIGKLFTMEARLAYPLPLAAGALRDGENTLSILPPRENDDIVVGDIALDSRPFKEALSEATVDVRVTDADSKKALPCRITIVDEEGALAPVYANTNQPLAVRPGVVYTADGKARLGMRPGKYVLYATRGFEYGLDTKRITVKSGQTLTIHLQIRREVSTPGLVNCDTHVHTFTFSRHGDATTDERVITLAGEGIELPIATDHNILTDLSGPAVKMGVRDYFTPVIGDEVTTKVGHFNTFPVQPDSRVPDFNVENWTKLLDSIRSTPGVQVVVLNHPHNIHNNFQPFARTNFNPVTGASLRVLEFDFDAIELMNSSAQQSDMMVVYRDWFALLNAGHRITGVGSSDGHDVSRYIVGQGRTYIMCDDANPAALDVTEACRSLLQGRALVSMGLLVRMTVNDQFGVGDLAANLPDAVRVKIKVLGPSWVKANRVELFADGVKIREQSINRNRALGEAKTGVKAEITWNIPRPSHDVYLVALATGPGVTAPYWAIPKPYQPSSRIWKAHVVGSTNPIWLDADGDGQFTSAREYAQSLVKRFGSDPAQLLPALAAYDEAVAAHAASFCQTAGRDVREPEFSRRLNGATEAVQRGFATFVRTLAPK